MKEELPINISKRMFWKYVNKKIKGFFHHYHVFNIINILFEEIVKDLKQEKTLKIFNFGELQLKSTKPRKYFDVNKQRVEMSKSNKNLRFLLSSKIKNKICQNIDINKTFKL